MNNNTEVIITPNLEEYVYKIETLVKEGYSVDTKNPPAFIWNQYEAHFVKSTKEAPQKEVEKSEDISEAPKRGRKPKEA